MRHAVAHRVDQLRRIGPRAVVAEDADDVHRHAREHADDAVAVVERIDGAGDVRAVRIAPRVVDGTVVVEEVPAVRVIDPAVAVDDHALGFEGSDVDA